MSAESPQSSADLTKSSPDASTGQAAPPGTDFGPNQWLVDELYQRYLADPGSVDRAWWSFFADYQPDTQAADAGAKPATTKAAGGQP